MIDIKNKTKIYIVFFILILILIGAYYRIRFIREVIFILVISFILSYILRPIYKIIINKININRKVIAATLIISIIGIFIVILTIFIPNIFNESTDLGVIIDNIESFITSFINSIKFSDSPIANTLSEQFTEKFNIFVVEFSKKVFDGIIAFSENIMALAIIPIVSYYFLSCSDGICNRILYLFPVERRNVIKKIGRDIDKVLGKYILGQILLSFIVGVMTFIGMIILQIKFPLILSMLNAILNIIPYFGAILGVIPVMLVALIDGPMKVLWVVIMFIIIQQIEGNIISPQITANSINMHPLTIIVLLLIGDKVGGFMGMILIIPIAVVFKVLYEDLDYYLF